MEFVEGEDLVATIARGPMPARRGAADRETDRRRARSRARARDHPSRSQAREHQGPIRRHGQGAGLRPREGAGRQIGPSGQDGVSMSPTITSPGDDDRRGVILGTAAYMVPNKRRGRAADKRADIWAFGVRAVRDVDRPTAFEGRRSRTCSRRSSNASRTGIALPAATSPRLRELLRRCVKKIRSRACATSATRASDRRAAQRRRRKTSR